MVANNGPCYGEVGNGERFRTQVKIQMTQESSNNFVILEWYTLPSRFDLYTLPPGNPKEDEGAGVCACADGWHCCQHGRLCAQGHRGRGSGILKSFICAPSIQ